MSLLQYAALAEQYTLTAADLARCASATRLSFLRSEDIGVAIVFSETRRCGNVRTCIVITDWGTCLACWNLDQQ